MKKDAEKKLKVLIESLVEQYINEFEDDIVAQDPLIKIFITPFTDVIKTAKGELEKTVAVTATTITSLAKQAAVLAIPFFASSMIDDIQEESQKKLEERLSTINERYADVLKRNWDTVRGRDVWGITFMLDPSFGIAEKFALRAPYAALGVLEVLTGGHPKVTELKQKAKKLVHHVTPDYLSSVGAATYGGGGGFGGGFGGYGEYGDFGGFGESVKRLREQQAQQAQPRQQVQQQQQAQPQQQPTAQQQAQLENVKKRIGAAISALKQDPAIQQAIQQGPVAKQMQAAALESIQSVVQPVLSASTYEQLKKAIGSEFNKYEQEYMKEIPEEVKNDSQALEQFQEQLVPQLKQSYIAVLVKQLQRLAKTHPSIAKPMQSLIQKIS